MRRLVGRPVVPGLALGRACIIRTPADVALMAPSAGVTPFWLGDDDAERQPDLVALVLADPHLADACSANPRCAAVIHAGSCGAVSTARAPTIDGVGAAASDVAHDELLLVDASRGIVLVDPSAQALARFQAGVDGTAPRRRFYLDSAHQQIRLADGRWVRVGACVRSTAEFEASLAAGADALFASLADAPLTPAEAAREAAGKPITFALPQVWSPIDELLEAAVDLDLTLVCACSASSAFSSLLAAVRTTCEEMTRSDRDWRSPRLGVVLNVGVDVGHATQAGIERVIAARPEGRACGFECEQWLAGAAAAARPMMTPLEVIVGAPSEDMVGVVARTGAAGVWTKPDHVSEWKSGLRACETIV